MASAAPIRFRSMSGRIRHPLIALLAAAVLFLAACGSSDDEDASVDDPVDEVTTTTEAVEEIDCSVEEVAEADRDEVPEVPDFGEDVDEVVVVEIADGAEEGCPFHALGFATLDLIGSTVSGEQFMNTWETGRPLSVQPGMLLGALDEMAVDMVVGEVRAVSIPPEQAYGSEGDPDLGVGPDEPVFFTVRLTAVTEDRAFCAPPVPLPNAGEDGKPDSVEIPLMPPTEVITEDLEPGDGVEAQMGDAVSVDYVGVSCAYGREFDSSYGSGPLDVQEIGSGLIEGFSEGLVGVRPGMVRIIQIPSEAAYGPNPPSPQIAVDDDLIFHISVESVTPAGSDGSDDGAEADDG